MVWSTVWRHVSSLWYMTCGWIWICNVVLYLSLQTVLLSWYQFQITGNSLWQGSLHVSWLGGRPLLRNELRESTPVRGSRLPCSREVFDRHGLLIALGGRKGLRDVHWIDWLAQCPPHVILSLTLAWWILHKMFSNLVNGKRMLLEDLICNECTFHV